LTKLQPLGEDEQNPYSQEFSCTSSWDFQGFLAAGSVKIIHLARGAAIE